MRVDGYKLFLQTIEKGLSNNVTLFFGNSEKVVLKMIENIKTKYVM